VHKILYYKHYLNGKLKFIINLKCFIVNMRSLGVVINDVIKNEDMFGHQIVLNFNKNGDSHKTLIGGCGSLLV